LNASDERGIDIIRNQISSFVNSKPLFNNGMKFVILDEVDYMTKNAQQALRYLLQKYTDSVRFCLICNYISRIDEGLQNEFIRLRFNQLPREQIIKFLKNVSETEELNLNEASLINIQKLFKSDLRSMLNFMQSNQDVVNLVNTNNNNKNNNKNNNNNIFNNLFIIEFKIWEEILFKLKSKENLDSIIKYIHLISTKYNTYKKSIIKEFLNYIIRNNSIELNSEFLNFVENIMHLQDCKNTYLVNYLLYKLK
jgi:replication factor C subunit 3/5